jgi:tRNA threonylcarbamoyladenosine biosynthesis protein TsaB
MRVLGIESATSAQSVALLEDDRVVAEASYVAEGGRGGRLMPTLDEVLRRAGVSVGDLDGVAVSVGPGSFTGLRVGVATAKGLALGVGVSLVGLSTLEVLAEGYLLQEGVVCALLDAHRGEVFTALFRRHEGRLERLTADAVVALEAVPVPVEGVMHMVGNGAACYRERLTSVLGERAYFTPAGYNAVPSAAVVGRLGMRRLAGTEGATPERPGPAQVVPVYLRRAEAEVNWEKGLMKSPLARVRG